MTVVPGTFTNFVTSSTAVVTVAETVVGTSPKISSPYPGAIFAVEFVLDFLTGASVTGIIWRVRQTSLTGTVVFTSPTIAAAASTQLPRQSIATVDGTQAEVASAVYVLTVAQVAATGNGSATNVFARVTQTG
jgi:hypothetical protein